MGFYKHDDRVLDHESALSFILAIFGPIWAFLGAPGPKLRAPPKSIIGPNKGHFGHLGPKNSPPSSQTGIYRKTKGTQSYFRIWGSYDPIDSGPSEAKNVGYMGVA